MQLILSNWKRSYLYIQKGVSEYLKGAVKNFWLPDGISAFAMEGGYRPLHLASSLVNILGPHLFVLSSRLHPFLTTPFQRWAPGYVTGIRLHPFLTTPFQRWAPGYVTGIRLHHFFDHPPSKDGPLATLLALGYTLFFDHPPSKDGPLATLLALGYTLF